MIIRLLKLPLVKIEKEHSLALLLAKYKYKGHENEQQRRSSRRYYC